MRKISADWVFPVSSAPIFKGIIVLASDGSIIEILDPDKVEVSIADVEHYDGVLCPGFVNTHCHLELSYLQGHMNRHTGLDAFIRNIEVLYKNERPSANKEQLYSLQSAEQEMLNNGIVAVGDIMSFIPSDEHCAVKEKSELYFHTFSEVYGSMPEYAVKMYSRGIEALAKIRSLSRNNNSSLSPHATYSLSPALFNLLKNFIDDEGYPTTIHHLENEDEAIYLNDGSGPVLERLNSFNIILTGEPIRGERPLLALRNLLPQQVAVLLVHNTVATIQDIRIAEHLFKTAWWCLCPNANLFIENRLPDLQAFSEVHHRITLGTDSLLSNESLSILEEMKTLQKAYPQTELETLIKWGTLNGANFLGIDKWAGSFSKGKNPGINLIEKVDVETLQLKKESRIKKITSCRPF